MRQAGQVGVAGPRRCGDQRVEVAARGGADGVQGIAHELVFIALQHERRIDSLAILGEARRDFPDAPLAFRIHNRHNSLVDLGLHPIGQRRGRCNVLGRTDEGELPHMAAQFREVTVYLAADRHHGDALRVIAERSLDAEKPPIADAGDTQQDEQHATESGEHFGLDRKRSDPAGNMLHLHPRTMRAPARQQDGA